MERHLYTREDCGCFADASNGAEYVNDRAIELAVGAGWDADTNIPDDHEYFDASQAKSEIADAAVDYLNENTLAEDGICFAFVDGDLLLIAEDDL